MKKQLLLLTFIAMCVPVLSARSEIQKPALAIIKPKPVVQPIIDPIKPVKPTKPITTQPIKPTPTNPTNPAVKPKPTIQPVRPITTPVIKPQPNLTEIGEIKKSVHSIVNDLDKKITAMQSAEKKNYLKYRILPQVKMYGVAYTRSGNAAEKKRFDAAVERLKKEINNAEKTVTTQQVTTLQPTPTPGKPGTTQPTKPTLPVKPGPIVDPVKPPVTTQPVRPQPGLDIIRQRLEAKVKALSTDLANEKVMTAKLKTEASMLKKKITELEKKLTKKPKLPIATQPAPKPAPNKPTPNPAPKPEIKPAPIQAKPVKGDDETYGLTGAKLEYLKLYPVYRQEVTTFKNGSARKNAYAQYKKAITSARATYRKDKDRNKYYATAKAAKAQYISATQAAKAKVTDLTTKLKKIYGIDSKTKSYIHKLFAYKSAAVNARYSENQRKKYKGYLDRIETYLRKITTQR